MNRHMTGLVIVMLIALIPLVSATDSDESWEVDLIGLVNKTITESEFEILNGESEMIWGDENGDEFSGVPLNHLIGLVDDEQDDPSFNTVLAQEGYSILVVGEDGYSTELLSTDLAEGAEVIVCNKQNGEPFPSWEVPPYPLKLFGNDVTKVQSVGNIAIIELIGVPEVVTEEESDETASIPSEGADIIYSGTIALSDKPVMIETSSGNSYEVPELTPLGALAMASEEGGFTYEVVDHSYEDRGILLLDAINEYRWAKDSGDWIVAVNGELIEDWGTDSTQFYNEFLLNSGDLVTYYFGQPPVTPENAAVLLELTVQ